MNFEKRLSAPSLNTLNSLNSLMSAPPTPQQEPNKKTNNFMKLRYNVDDRLPLSQLALYALQWFILAVAVVVTSVFVAQGSPEEKLFYAQ